MATDYFAVILDYMFSPIGLILITILILLIIYSKYYAGKEKSFKTQKLDKTILETAKEIIKTTGIKQKNRLLRYNYIVIGKVLSVAKILYYAEKDIKNNLRKRSKAELLTSETKLNTEVKETDTPLEFIEFQIVGLDPISQFLAIFGLGIKYFLVDKEFLVDLEKNQDYIIADGTQYWRLAGVNIFSDKGRRFITAIAYKKMYEQTLESELNFIPKLTYLEVKQAKTIEKAKAFTQLEKDRWSSRLEDLTEED